MFMHEQIISSQKIKRTWFLGMSQFRFRLVARFIRASPVYILLWSYFFLSFPPQNVRIDSSFPAEYFELQESSLNGSYHRVKALKAGLTLIDGTLSSVVDEVSCSKKYFFEDSVCSRNLLLTLSTSSPLYSERQTWFVS